ncbi:TPA: hypothetical protein N0F65_008336, partial [Lagenidium giganteum]
AILRTDRSPFLFLVGNISRQLEQQLPRRMGRGRKWSSHENESLVRSYIAVSEDSVHGTEQNDDRSAQALRNLWHTISHDVAKFVGCNAIVESRKKSGKGPEDVLSDAKILFCEQQGMEFAFVPKFTSATRHRHPKRPNSVCQESEQRPMGRKNAKESHRLTGSDDRNLLREVVQENDSHRDALLAEI